MRIEIKDTVVGTKPGEKISEIISRLSAIENASELCQQLDTIKLEEIDEDLDLSHWIGVLSNIDDHLSIHVNYILKCGESALLSTDISYKKNVISILKFLKVLLKAGKRKKYFQSFDHVGKLLKAYDIDIVELALSVIFYACLPSASMSSSPLEADWKEGVEVSQVIADDALVILEGLGLLSSEYGFMDYLRGHYPDSANHRDQTYVIKLPVIEEEIAVSGEKSAGNAEGKAEGKGASGATTESAVSTEGKDTAQPEKKSTQKNDSTGKTTTDELEYVISIPTGGEILELLSESTEITMRPEEKVLEVFSKLGKNVMKNQELVLLSVVRGIDGLKGTQIGRLRVVTLRVQCLLIMSHSRITHDLLQPYLKAGSAILKDLIALSDISSEPFAELLLEHSSLSAVSLILKCTLGLLEFNMRRRGPLLDEILIELGLSRAGGPNSTDTSDRTYESPWGSIVMSAAAVSTSVFDALNDVKNIENSKVITASSTEKGEKGEKGGNSDKSDKSEKGESTKLSVMTVDKSEKNENERNLCERTTILDNTYDLSNFYAEYVCLSLNFFATCMTIRDSSNVPNDTPIVGAIVGILVAAISPLRSVLTQQESSKSSYIKMREDEWLIKPLISALNCLEICVSKIFYQAAFRESEGLGPVSDIIEIFGNSSHLLPNQLRSTVKYVLDSAFSLLCSIATNTRRSAPGPTESGIQVLYQQYFTKLCCQVFKSPFKEMKTTWTHLLNLIRLAIDAEPAFLAQFLRSTYAGVLTEVLKKSSRNTLLPNNCEVLIMPLTRLAVSMCITPEGLSFVINNNFIPLVVQILVDPALCYPQGDGLSPDTVSRCGRVMIQLARDHEQTRPQIKASFSSQIEALCTEAKRIHRNLPIREEPSLESPRIQVLQRLSNLCIVIENMASEGRRQTNDLIKGLVSEEMIELLVRSFPCTLPPSRQLFAQLSMRHTGIPFFGYYPAAKAITGLLRVAANLVPQALLPVLFRAVDETLCHISASKAALRIVSEQQKQSQSQDQNKPTPQKNKITNFFEVDNNLGGGFSQALGPNSWPKRRARSRGGSFGAQGVDVLVLGVLDCIPHKCVCDIDFLEKELDPNQELETQVYKFLCSTLHLEWLSTMISAGLLPMQRSQGQSLITAGRDVFRRLFAFQRSLVLEICRFSASKWTPKPLNDCRNKRGLNESYAEFDSSEDEKKIFRVPQEYLLRVLNGTGALIREECEIECSRGVFTASPGAVCVAYQRGQTASGVVRFRTAHGWLSEYRRDQQRDPIMELLALTPCRAKEGAEGRALDDSLAQDPKKRKLMESMTVRESTSYSMARVHNSLRKVALHLVGLCHVDPAAQRLSSSRSIFALSGSASLLSGSLSKIFNSFLTHPDSCLQEDEIPESLPLLKGEISLKTNENDEINENGKNNCKYSKKGDKDGKEFFSDEKKRMKNSAKTPEKSEKEKDKKTPSRRSSDSVKVLGTPVKLSFPESSTPTKGDDDEDEIPRESVTIDCATACLYFGAVAKNILDPVLQDRSGNFNTYLVRALSANGAIDSFLSALIFVLATISDAINDSKEKQNNQKDGKGENGKDGKGEKGEKDGKEMSKINQTVQVFSQKKVDSSIGTLIGKGSSKTDKITPGGRKKGDSKFDGEKSKNDKNESNNKPVPVNNNKDEKNGENGDKGDKGDNSSENDILIMSRAGRCALHSLPYMLILLRKLVQRESYFKSPITASMVDLSDDLGTFQMHELLYKIFSSISKCLLPAVRSKLVNQLPCELQQEWFGIIGDLVISLQAPLPPVISSLPPSGAPASQRIIPTAAVTSPFGYSNPNPASTPSTYGPGSGSGLGSGANGGLGGNPSGGSGIGSGSERNRLDPLFATAATEAPPPRAADPVDEIVQSYLQAMGFVRADIEAAMVAMQSNETEIVMEYLLSNPGGADFTPDSEGQNPVSPGGDSGSGGVDGAGGLALSAMVADISVVERDERDESMASYQADISLATGAEGALSGIEGVEGGEGGDSVLDTTSDVTGSVQIVRAVEPTVDTAADITLLSRDLGNLITELSRLCVEEGLPQDNTSDLSLITPSHPEEHSLPSEHSAENTPEGLSEPSVTYPPRPEVPLSVLADSFQEGEIAPGGSLLGQGGDVPYTRLRVSPPRSSGGVSGGMSDRMSGVSGGGDERDTWMSGGVPGGVPGIGGLGSAARFSSPVYAPPRGGAVGESSGGSGGRGGREVGGELNRLIASSSSSSSLPPPPPTGILGDPQVMYAGLWEQYRESELDRPMYRQSDRQDRQTEWQTERQTDRELDRQLDRERDRQSDRERVRQEDRERDRQGDRMMGRERDRRMERLRDGPPNIPNEAPADDEVTKESSELLLLARSFREHSVEYVLEVSSLGDELSKWGAVPERSQTLIPQLSNFFVTVNEVPHTSGIMSVLPLMYIDLIKTLIDRITKASDFYLMQSDGNRAYPKLPQIKTHEKDKLPSQLYGSLHLLLCLLRNKKVRYEIDPYFTRTFAGSLVDTLLDLIKSYKMSLKSNYENSSNTVNTANTSNNANNEETKNGDNTDKNDKSNEKSFWPIWVSPLCVLLHELITASMGITEMKTVILSGKNKRDDSEEKTEEVLEEEKDEKECEKTGFQEKSESVNFESEEKNGKTDGEIGIKGEKGFVTVENGDNVDGNGNIDNNENNETDLLLELGELLSNEVERSSLLLGDSWYSVYDSIFSIMKSSSIYRSDKPDSHTAYTAKSSSNMEKSNGNDSNGNSNGIDTSENHGNDGEIRYLDPSSQQGVLLLIHALLNKKTLCENFVTSHGVDVLLSVPACSASADSLPMLSLIVQRCMESTIELNQQMLLAIRTFLKPGKEARIPLPVFLSFSTPHVLKAPYEFMRAMMTCVRFIKTKTNNEDNSIVVELYKKDILEKRILNAEIEYARDHPEADTVALQALETLLNYLTNNEKGEKDGRGDNKIVKGADNDSEDKIKKDSNGSNDNDDKKDDGNEPSIPTNGANGTNGIIASNTSNTSNMDATANCLYFKGDVLESLSDCTVVLRRFPVLLAQYKLFRLANNVYSTDRDAHRIIETVFLPDFLIRHYFSLDGSEKNAVGMSEIRSACRLLVALSAQRGSPRGVVLTSLVNAIRDNATEKEILLPPLSSSYSSSSDSCFTVSDGPGTYGVSTLTDTRNQGPGSGIDSSSCASSGDVDEKSPIRKDKDRDHKDDKENGKDSKHVKVENEHSPPTPHTPPHPDTTELDLIEASNKRLRSLTRLAVMVTLVVKASGTSGVQDLSSSSMPNTPQQVSVDVVNHFISTDLPGLLTAALSSIPLAHHLAGDAINAILDPLEIITRPKLLSNLDKLHLVNMAAQNKALTPGALGPVSEEEMRANDVTGSSAFDGEGDGEGYRRLPEEGEMEGDDNEGVAAMSNDSLVLGGGNPGVAGVAGDDLSVTFSNSSDSTNMRHQADSEDSDAGADLEPSDPAERVTFLNLQSASANTNTRTSRNVYDGSISSATLPSDEGLFGDDEEGGEGEEGDEDEDDEYNDNCGDDDDHDGEDDQEGGEIYGEEEADFEEDEEEEDEEDDFDVQDDDDDDNDSEDEERAILGIGREELRLSRRHFNSPAAPEARAERTERAERARRYFCDLPIMFELPLGGSVTDMVQNANAMIILEDYGNRNNGNGADPSNLLINDHNPFHLDRFRRTSGSVSNFVTPPDRIRHDPLRLLMQQLYNDEQGGFSPDSDVYNILMSSAPGDVASILLGGDGTVGGEFNITVTNTPGARGARIGVRPSEGQGDGDTSITDLLPGGVDRALLYRGHGVHHPLLLDDGGNASSRPSRIAMLVHQAHPAPTGQSGVHVMGRPTAAQAQSNTHFNFGIPAGGIPDVFADERANARRSDGIDFRIGSDLSRILMDETDSIVSSAMSNMPGGNRGNNSILSSGGRIIPYTAGLDASDLLFEARRTASSGSRSQPPTGGPPSEQPIALELLQRHLRNILVDRLPVTEDSPALTPTPTPPPPTAASPILDPNDPDSWIDPRQNRIDPGGDSGLDSGIGSGSGPGSGISGPGSVVLGVSSEVRDALEEMESVNAEDLILPVLSIQSIREMRRGGVSEGSFIGDVITDAFEPPLGTVSEAPMGVAGEQGVRDENVLSTGVAVGEGEGMTVEGDVTERMEVETLTPLSSTNIHSTYVPTISAPTPTNIPTDLLTNILGNVHPLTFDISTLDFSMMIDTIQGSQIGAALTLPTIPSDVTIESAPAVDSVPTQSPAIPVGSDLNTSVGELGRDVAPTPEPSVEPSVDPSLAVEVEAVLAEAPPATQAETIVEGTQPEVTVSDVSLPVGAEGAEGALIEGTEDQVEGTEGLVTVADGAEGQVEVEVAHVIPCPLGYESDVFYSLPDFMQQEIVDQHEEENGSDQVRILVESVGYDYETFSSLPESIRLEILDQARRDQAVQQGGSGMPPADPSNSQEMDNASFLVSLSPDLRAEVLLTADAAFIATLPPELVAEALMHRERAAVHWQQREMQQTRHDPARAPRGTNRTVVRANGGRSALRPVVQEDEEDDGSEDEEDMDSDYPRPPRNARETSRAQQQAALSPAEGLMLLPSDDSDRTLAPAELLPILARLIQDERLPIRSQYLYRLLQNIAKNPRLRDAVLRLLVCLLVEDTAAANRVVAELTDNAQTEYTFSSDNDVFENKEEASRTLKRRAYALPNTALKGRKTLSQLSASRLVAVLFHLSSANISCVYDILCPRIARGGAVIKIEEARIVDQNLESVDENGKSVNPEDKKDDGEKMDVDNEGESVPAEGIKMAGKDGGKDEKVGGREGKEGGKEGGKEMKEAAKGIEKESQDDLDGEVKSTDSLLEMLMALFSHTNFTSNANDLSELTAFINVVSSPLEFLSESGSENRVNERYLRELKKGAVAVPMVGMNRNSLRCLCEVLLSDICSKNVSDNVNAAISRLAIVRANRTVLTELIAEVVVDLAAQSQNKLMMFLSSLLAVRKRKGGDIPGSLVPYRPSANELPLGEAGGRYHERFLRAMETLDSVAAKTKRNLLDLTPADQLAPAWSSLHNVLTELHAYILDDDDGKSESTSRPQSTLISLLSKLLPVVEAFFLVHVTDILNGDSGGNMTSRSTGAASGSASSSADADVTISASASVNGGISLSPGISAGVSAGVSGNASTNVSASASVDAQASIDPSVSISPTATPAQSGSESNSVMSTAISTGLNSAIESAANSATHSATHSGTPSATASGPSTGTGTASISGTGTSAGSYAGTTASRVGSTVSVTPLRTSSSPRLVSPRTEGVSTDTDTVRVPLELPVAVSLGVPMGVTPGGVEGGEGEGVRVAALGPRDPPTPTPTPVLRLAHQPMPGERYRNTPAYAALNLSLISGTSERGEGGINGPEDRSSIQNSRSFRMAQSQSFSFPHALSHSSSGVGINFFGNSSLNRAQRLLSFVHAHKAVLNLIVRSRPAVLEGSLAALIRVTQLRSHLGFDAKRKYFFTQLHQMRPDRGRRSVHLQLRRGQVFEDSFHQLRMKSAEDMAGRLQVNFHGEEGIDAGGLTREWYLVLSREIFNPNYALFTAAADGATFQPNPLSMINMNHLDYFKFVGRVIGKAICDGQLMDAHFTRSFYKHVLGNPVDYTDLEAIEPEIFKSLKQILTLRLDELGLELTFSAESHIFGKHEVVDLIPGGRNVMVTDENKAEYIRLVAHHRMTAAIRSQIEAFLDGFYEQVPPELISIFSPTELELVICGLPDVDVDELYANTEYHQYRANDTMILWFWDVLRGFNREERALFLQFVTGTSKVPLEGFGSLQGMRGVQRFSIHKAYGEVGLLPTAHTCFNQLDLPMYSSQEDLRDKLLMAIKEGSEGFGFA